jgi:3-oxoacyl-[acyl-carrier protein] reductase
MKLKGKVALVTGASRGIGRATAIRLAQDGCDVIVNYMKEEKKAQEVVKEITKLGRKAIAIKADVSQEDQVKALMKKVVATFGSLDIVVNNAGIVFDVPINKEQLNNGQRP